MPPAVGRINGANHEQSAEYGLVVFSHPERQKDIKVLFSLMRVTGGHGSKRAAPLINCKDKNLNEYYSEQYACQGI